MAEFLDAAFDRRLRFGVPPWNARPGGRSCWFHGLLAPALEEAPAITTKIEVVFGPHKGNFSMADPGDYPGLFDMIRPQIPNNLRFGAIKHRLIKTVGRSYLSNGCAHCDPLVGGSLLSTMRGRMPQQYANFRCVSGQ